MNINRRKKLVVLGTTMAVALTAVGTGKSAIAGQTKYDGNYYVKTNYIESTVQAGDENAKEMSYAEQMLYDLTNTLHIEEKNVYKDETVYAFADNQGNIKTVLVNEHLKNTDNAAVLTDRTDLKDIVNLKGYEEFTLDGDKITWNANGEDIYYQGTTDRSLPVTVNVKYYLDGSEISASELAGKSGRVTIRYEYTNTATVTVEDTEVKVPFAAITGLMLDEKFTNVSVTNGKCIEEGNTNIVIGYALPGMSDNLDVDSAAGIPEYFEVSADVDAFSIDMGLTLVTSASSIDFGDGMDFTVLDEMVNNIDNAGDQLASGSTSLSEGAATLYTKMGEFAGGVSTLTAAINLLSSQTGTLTTGVAQINGGAQQINTGMTALNTSLNTAMTDEEKAQVAATVTAQFAPGTDYYNQISTEAAQSFKATMTSEDVVNSMSAVLIYQFDEAGNMVMENGAPKYSPLYMALLSTGMADEQIKGMLAQYAGALAQGIGNKAAASIGDSVVSACCKSTIQGVILGTENTKGVIAANIQPLVTGASSLATGTNELNNSMPQLTAGISQLVAGAAQLETGAGQLSEGAGTLSEGATALMEGVGTFNEEAVTSIVNAYNGDIKTFVTNVKAMFTAATEYETFTLVDEQNTGATKFIIKTEGVYAD